MFQFIKSIFAKSDFDYDCPGFDLFKFHPQIKVFLAFNGIFFNNQDSYLRFFWPTICILLASIGAAFQVMFVGHGILVADYSFASECFCYFIIVATVPLVNLSVLFNRKKLMAVLTTMNRDFMYICGLEPKYRNTFLKGQLIVWQLCICWFVFGMMVLLMYDLSTIGILFYQSLFGTQTENTIRPLVFPMWLPADDPYRTPNYEIFLFLEIFITFTVPQTFFVYIYIFFHILLHYYFIMNLIIFDCELLFEGLDDDVIQLPSSDPRRLHAQAVLNGRIRRIVKWHNLVFQSIEIVSSIYGPPLVYQVMFSSLAICLSAYQVAESLDEGKLHIIFIMLLIGTCIQLWIPCYLGTLFKNKALAVGDAIWNSGWHLTPLGRLVRQDIIFIIMRAQQPVNIKFTGLPKLELETFSSIISTAYSYFNLLRQYNK